MNFYLARQPIFDRHQMVIGYEIVYRNSIHTEDASDAVYNEATSRLLLNSYLDAGMDTLLGGHIAFIRFDENLVLQDTPLLLNKSTTVIQIGSDIEPSDEFIDKIKRFKSDGYLIGLSDYKINYKHEALIALSDIIQVDLSENTVSDLKKIIRRFELTTQILLACNIQNHDTYDAAKKLGFELFEGYYFCKPTLTKGRVLQQSSFHNIEILKLANADQPDIKLISSRIEEDVNLTVKLLRLVNSSHYFMNKIHSVQHALAMIGIKAFRNWLNIALMDSFLDDDQTPEIIKQSMVRMRMMENIGNACGMDEDQDSLKLIGLLSVLDVLLDKDMMEAVNPLPIDREMKITLFGRDSRFSDIFQMVLAYEKGSFNAARRYAVSANFSLDELPPLYTEALKWADDLYHHIYPNEEQSA